MTKKPRRRSLSVVKGGDTVALGLTAIARDDVLADLKRASHAILSVTGHVGRQQDANLNVVELDAVLAAHYALRVAIAHLQRRDPWGT